MKTRNIIQIILFLSIVLPFVYAAPPVPDTNYSFADFLLLDFKIGVIQSRYMSMEDTTTTYNFSLKAYDIKANIDKNDITQSTFSFILRRNGLLMWKKEKWKTCLITGTTDCQRDFKTYADAYKIKNDKKTLTRILNLQKRMSAYSETSPSVD